MKRFELVIFGFLIAGLMCSCKYKCPGFPDEELHWIPYNVNDTLRYSDSKDTIYLVVKDFYKSGPSSFRGLTMDYWCDFNGYYYTSTSSKYDYQIKDTYSSLNDSKIQITIQGDIFDFHHYSKYTRDSITVTCVADSFINNIEYKDLYILQKDTIKNNPRITRVIKSSEKGVIEFYDSKYKLKWNLINE